MTRLILFLALLAPSLVGCTFSHGGSQAVTVDPFRIGTGDPVVTPAHGPGFDNGQAMDLRR